MLINRNIFTSEKIQEIRTSMWRQVRIANGGGPIEETALFDTGAAVTLIDGSIVEKLGLKWLGGVKKLRGVTGTTFQTYEFFANIFDPEIGRWRKQKVYAPEKNIRIGEKIIIGRDFMHSTGIELKNKNNTQRKNPIVLALIFFLGVITGEIIFSQ